MKHDARGLRGLARRVGNVKALNPQGVDVIWHQIQRLHQGASPRLLRAFLAEQAGQLDVGVVLRHLQPNTALLTWVVDHADLGLRLLGQGFDQNPVNRHTGNQGGRDGHVDVMLGDEGLKNQNLDRNGRRTGNFILAIRF